MTNSKTSILSKIAVWGVFILIILFCSQWYFLDSNLKDYKEEKEKELQTIENLRKHALVEFASVKENDSTIQVRIDDIALINKRYDNLVTYIENNTNRAESLIDKDLDRLNLYLTVGIGFIGILGVFVPILVNIMSVQDLREKISSIDPEEISEKIDELKSKIEDMETYYQKSGPAITSLILQNAIGRFFNISPRLITKLKREKDKQYFIKLLETIKNGFDHCKQDNNHSFGDNQFLNETIVDFRIYISDQTFQSSFFTEIVVRKFGDLSIELGNLIESTNNQQENESIDKIKENFEEIIKNLNLI